MGYSLRRHQSEDLVGLFSKPTQPWFVKSATWVALPVSLVTRRVYSDTWFPNQPDSVILSLNTS